MGIEPTYPAWKAGALPLSYTRKQEDGAVDEARTRDLHLGKVALYQLSYYRMIPVVRAKRLELIRLPAPDPKSGASAIPPRPPIYRQKW